MSSKSKLVSMLERVPLDRLRPFYERHGLEPKNGVQELVNEICLDGSNTFAALFRGWEGVPYEEIVRDVAEKTGVKFTSSDTLEAIEQKLLERLVARYLDGASAAEREQIQEILCKAGSDHEDIIKQIGLGALKVGTLGLLVKQFGAKVVAGIVERIMLMIIAKRAAGEAAKRAAAAAGYAIPVLNVLMVGWTFVDIAGPAFRKTVPTVLDIALLRLEFGP